MMISASVLVLLLAFVLGVGQPDREQVVRALAGSSEATAGRVDVRGVAEVWGAVAPALRRLPSAATASEASESLSDRALSAIRVLAEEIGSRPAGSDAERTAASYLARELRAMGYAVETVSFEFSSRFGSGTSQNVIASSPDEDPTAPLVVVGAHYDSVPMGPGANDNASGTATMLEVARELRQLSIPGAAVRFVAFGAEEVGLFGSRNYVQHLSAADRRRLEVAISIDMMAVGDRPSFGGSEAWVMEAAARAASQGYRPLNQSGSLRRMSDHASFLDEGLPAIMFHWVDDPFYHTALDVVDNIQPECLELMGAIAIELVRVAATP